MSSTYAMATKNQIVHQGLEVKYEAAARSIPCGIIESWDHSDQRVSFVPTEHRRSGHKSYKRKRKDGETKGIPDDKPTDTRSRPWSMLQRSSFAEVSRRVQDKME